MQMKTFGVIKKKMIIMTIADHRTAVIVVRICLSCSFVLQGYVALQTDHHSVKAQALEVSA